MSSLMFSALSVGTWHQVLVMRDPRGNEHIQMNVNVPNLREYDKSEMARSVQMRLYTMQKRHFLLAFTTFAALFLISVLLGAASPDMVERMTEHAFDKNRTGKLPRGPWVLPSPKLSRFNHSTIGQF